jgi:poly-gamma-glutamate synthesis protein (capsule biosynthesis protein)
MIGRPGLNPLRFKTTYHVEKKYFDVLQEVVEKTDMNAAKNYSISNGYANPLPEGELTMGSLGFKLDTVTEQRTAPNKKDLDRMIANIQEAKRQADYVLVSIHSHKFAGTDTVNPAEFMKTYCKACIDAGADAILGHGPHELQGIEIYKGKPIFYSLGNFIFQTETVSAQPADAYQNKGMPHDTFVGEYMANRSKNGTRGYCVQPNIWRSVVAGFEAEDGRITAIKLYPITLHMDFARSRIGFPELSDDEQTLHYLAQLSAPYGTQLDISGGVATIKL